MSFEQSKIVGRFLKSIREKKGETQQEVAKRVKMSTGAVFAWENGPCTVTHKKLSQIAKAFQLDLNEIEQFKRLSGFYYSTDEINEYSVLVQLQSLPKESRDRIITQVLSTS